MLVGLAPEEWFSYQWVPCSKQPGSVRSAQTRGPEHGTRVQHSANGCYGNVVRHIMKQVSSEAFLSLHNRVISSTLSIRCDGKEETESAVKTDLAGAELPNYCQCFQALPHCDSLCFRSFSH